MSELFLAQQPALAEYWRAIVLFGRNVASYKFAWAKALLALHPRAGQVLTLEDLALPFATQIAQHLRTADKQATSASSQFLEACRQFNQGQRTESQLVDLTVRLGFVNVLDAFHVVGSKALPVRFFVDERRAFLHGWHQRASAALIHHWEPEQRAPAAF